MKRRHFLQSVAAIGAVPTGIPAPASAISAAPQAVSDYMLSVARLHTQMNGHASAHALGQTLGVGPGTARAIQKHLTREGLVSAPNASGLSRLNDPFAGGQKTAPGSLRRRIEALLDPAEPAKDDTALVEPQPLQQSIESGPVAIPQTGGAGPE